MKFEIVCATLRAHYSIVILGNKAKVLLGFSILSVIVILGKENPNF